MSMYIAGMGVATPPHQIEQRDAAEVAKRFYFGSDAQRDRLMPVMYRRTGVKTRHSTLLESPEISLAVEHEFYKTANSPDDGGPTTSDRMARYESAAGPLAADASRAALADAAIDARQITHIVTVSCSGFAAPGFDQHAMRELDIRPDVARTHVGFMGCHGALNGLRVARAFVEADPAARVLVCAVELCSLHYAYGWDPERIVANALFADGAAAVVATAAPGPSAPSWQVTANGSTIVPDSADVMSWRIGNHGFEMTLSPKLPEVIHERLRPWLAGWLADQSLSIESVGSWAVHPGGPRILGAFLESTGLPPEAMAPSRAVLAEYGNMSSPTVLFILRRLRAAGDPLPCVALGFGPGMAVEAMLIRE